MIGTPSFFLSPFFLPPCSHYLPSARYHLAITESAYLRYIFGISSVSIRYPLGISSVYFRYLLGIYLVYLWSISTHCLLPARPFSACLTLGDHRWVPPRPSATYLFLPVNDQLHGSITRYLFPPCPYILFAHASLFFATSPRLARFLTN